MSPDTFRQKRHKISHLGEKFKTVPLCDVTTEMLEEWLEELLGELGLSAAGTFNNYLKPVRTFFNFNKKHVTLNPAENIPLRDDSIDEVARQIPPRARLRQGRPF